MSDYEHKAGNGTLFKNPNKTPDNNQPEHKGGGEDTTSKK